jgi:hypothetical protein
MAKTKLVIPIHTAPFGAAASAVPVSVRQNNIETRTRRSEAVELVIGDLSVSSPVVAVPGWKPTLQAILVGATAGVLHSILAPPFLEMPLLF